MAVTLIVAEKMELQNVLVKVVRARRMVIVHFLWVGRSKGEGY